MQLPQQAFTATTVPPAATDDLLIEALLAGRERSYEQLVESYGGRMLAVARRLLRDEQEAQDAVQDALLSAFRNLHRFRRDSRLGTWLHRITVNAALMRMRYRASRPEVPLAARHGMAREGRRSAGPVCSRRLPDPESVLLGKEIRRQVRESIDRLPPLYRTVLMLRDIEELDTGEVASRLGISANAVKIRLHRARRALASDLFGLGGDERGPDG